MSDEPCLTITDNCPYCGAPKNQDMLERFLRTMRWEPGTLTQNTLERVLQDALADLWQYYNRDTYSKPAVNRTHQSKLFCEKLSDLIRTATGQGFRVSA